MYLVKGRFIRKVFIKLKEWVAEIFEKSSRPPSCESRLKIPPPRTDVSNADMKIHPRHWNKTQRETATFLLYIFLQRNKHLRQRQWDNLGDNVPLSQFLTQSFYCASSYGWMKVDNPEMFTAP